MPSEQPHRQTSSGVNRKSLRSFTKKGQDTTAPKPAPAQPSLSPRKEAKDLNKRFQMASKSARQPAPAPARVPQAPLASNPVAVREGDVFQSPSHPAHQRDHVAAMRTAHSIMTGTEPEPEPEVQAPQATAGSGSRRAEQGLPPTHDEGDHRGSAAYLMKLGILLNIEALFKTSPDDVQDLLADLGRTYPDLLEGAGLQRLAR